MTVPADITVRAASADDLQAILDLVNACSMADKGRADTISEHILDMWEDTDLAVDSVVLVTSAGQIVGYTAVCAEGELVRLDIHTCVHPNYRKLGLEEALLVLVDERARQLLARTESPIAPKIKAWAFYTTSRQMLVQAGYQVTSSELNLEIFLTEQPALPQALANITVRPYQPGQDDRAVHAVIQEAFQDIGGRPYRLFEEWVEGAINHTHFDPRQLSVALDREQMVGAITCRTYEDELEGPEGHITQLGVLRPWRKRGIARHLMQQVFSTYYQRGIHHITISVDAHNTTGAIQLYQGMGMRQYEQVDHLLKSL
jgi:mycothiol synthase